MRGIEIAGLSLHRNGDIAIESDNLTNFFVKRGAKLKAQSESLKLADLREPSHTQVRDELIVIIKSKELRFSTIFVKENWSVNSGDEAHLIQCSECSSFVIDGLQLKRVYGLLPSVLEEYLSSEHDYNSDELVVSSYDPYEKIEGDLMRGKIVELKNSHL